MLSHATSYANFSGSDDFNDNSKDTTKWGTDFIQGGGALTETNQRLQFTATGASTNDVAVRPWIANNGSFTANWILQLDVNLPALTLSANQLLAIGLVVRDGDNLSSTFSAQLNFDTYTGSRRYFHSGYRVNGGSSLDVDSTTAATSAAVRIRYDAATTTLFAEADADGAVGGYNFTTFESQNISAWNMTATSVFQGNAIGATENSPVITSGNNIFGDNFVAAVPEPSTYILLIAGIGIVALKRLRRIRAQAQF